MADFALPRRVEEMGVASTADQGASAVETYDGLPFYQHMLAGAVAGVGEHCAMFPIDTVKTRMQALRVHGQHSARLAAHATKGLLRHEGLGGLYRGVTAVAMGAGPAHALYFGSYEASRRALGVSQADGEHHPVETALAGATAMLVHDAFMNPWDVTKQRMQVAARPYRGAFHAFSETLRHEGFGTFYRSYRTTVVMNMPYAATQFALYESSKTYLGGEAARDGEEGLRTQLLAGGLAGGSAAALTTPLDVVKTRLQLDGYHGERRYLSNAVIPTMRAIVREEGAAALWRGLKPRVLYNAPAAAICWGAYETMKSLME